MGKLGVVPAKRRSIGANKGRPSPRGLAAIRKAPPYNRSGNRKPMFADRNQVSVLQKGINLLSNEGNEDDAASSESSGFGTKKAPMKVAVRVRPLNSKESTANAREIIQVSGPNMLIFDPERRQEEFFYRNEKLRDVTARKYKNLKFAFDHVYDSSGTNQIIYEDIMKPLLSTLLSGFNCSVFAYGATGSGKTYTMLGSSQNRGLTYLTINDLYERLDSMKEEFETEVVISYFEVYNEQVRDLLNSNGKQLTIMEVGNGIAIKDLSFHHPKDIDHLLDMLREGNANRSQHPTDHNAESSRSHAVLQVHIRMRERHKDMNSSSRTSKLVMVDLAGSEKGCATGFSGQRFREGSSINKSLLALGKIMENLASGKRTFSFRDSKLTRILKDSLGGNCRTVMIANISPAASLYEDTLNTLRYAQKAKKISCNASKNIITVQSCLSQYTRVMDEMTAKIQGLEKQLKEKDDLIEDKELELGEKDEEISTLKHLKAMETDRANSAEMRRLEAEHLLEESERKLRCAQNNKLLPPSDDEWEGVGVTHDITFNPITEIDLVDSDNLFSPRMDHQQHSDQEFNPNPIVPPSTSATYSSIPNLTEVGLDLVDSVNIFGDMDHQQHSDQDYLQLDCGTSDAVFRNFDETQKFLESESDFHIKTFPKLEKLFHDFQLKLEQYYKLRSLNGATADQRYAKAMTKVYGKMTSLIKAVQRTLCTVKTHVDQPVFRGESTTVLANINVCRSSEKLLWDQWVNKALLNISSNENKLLNEQVNSLTSQLLRKEELLKDFAKLCNQLYNNLNHYGHLAPATKGKYDKLVSSYCSPSLKFAENSNVIQSLACAFLQSQVMPDFNEDIGGSLCVAFKREKEIKEYIKTIEERWLKIHSRLVDMPEIQHQVGNLLQYVDSSKWSDGDMFRTSMMSTDNITEFDINSSFGSLYAASEPSFFSAEVNVLETNEQSPDVDMSAESIANQTVTLTQSRCFNDTFIMDQQSQGYEKEAKENDDPLTTSSFIKQMNLEITPSCSSDLFDIKTVPECVAEFSSRIGAKMTKTPPTFGYTGPSTLGLSVKTDNFCTPGVSPSGAGPSFRFGHKQGKIPVITPRSVSPQKTYPLGIGANPLKRVASVGKLPTSAKLQPQSTSPYLKTKKAALNTIRSGPASSQYRHLLSTSSKAKPALPPVIQKNPQQQKGMWQRPLPKNNNNGGGTGER